MTRTAFHLATIAVAGFAMTQAAAAADFDWKFAHIVSPDTPSGKAAAKLAELIEERSGGRMSVEVFPSAQLGDDAQIIEQIQLDTVQMGIPPTAKLGNFEPRMQVFDLPFIFPTPEAAYTVLDGEIGRELLDTLDEKGLKGLAYWESGFKHLTADHPIESLADLSGVKVRTMDSPLIIDQYRSWGANPIPIAFAEVYNALQTGVANAQENSLTSIDTMKFYEVQSDLTLSGHAYLPYAFIVSKQAWDGLPEDLQKVVQDTVTEMRDYNRQLTADVDSKLVDKFEEKGMRVHELGEDARAKFVEASRDVHENFESVVTPELLQRIYEATE
ncbi:TRAP transporter substrate-binding protein [Jiella avicenniae]|uniref:TRAP transporter substrate-binding protein n=1 Tax=Jiella avicenniae TaxID=2907202 RepID=A0A9X1NYB7_9HYPH|nr:TRAP transporter substrate-binding protein [Jiella avicenniae]MCE7027143.1 TRAP transporter substrate-binding protein [Jiella avicenniae]